MVRVNSPSLGVISNFPKLWFNFPLNSPWCQTMVGLVHVFVVAS